MNASMDAGDLLQILEGLPVAVFVLDANGRPSYANHLAIQLLGKGIDPQASPSQLAQVYAAFLAGTDQEYPSERMPVVRALQGESTSVDDMELRLPDGRAVPLAVWGTPIRDSDGRVRYAAAAFVDMTDRRRAEFAEAEAERLRQLDDMKSAFLSAISHELRTPLTSVLGFAQILERQGLKLPREEFQDLLSRLAANARRLQRLVLDLLDIDRFLRGTLTARMRPTDVSSLVVRVLEDLDLEQHSIKTDIPGSVRATVDPAQVERIIETLILNAAKHTPPDTRVWVRLKDVAEGVLLVVEDAGPGISDEKKQQIFRPFERGASAPAHRPGLAVGLALVAKFAELHSGKAWVEDRPGGGASFHVLLKSGKPSKSKTA